MSLQKHCGIAMMLQIPAVVFGNLLDLSSELLSANGCLPEPGGKTKNLPAASFDLAALRL